MQPFYHMMVRPRRMPLVHRLLYTWDGWPSGSSSLPSQPDLSSIDPLWLGDGFRRLGCRWSRDLVQMSFEVEPAVSPAFFAMRVKGRIDHAMRQSGTPVQWSRKVGVRSLGENTDVVVEHYLSLQQRRGDFADPRYGQTLAEFSREYPSVRLDDPAESARGRYWYNLHLVAVTGRRWRMGREDFLPKIASAIPAWAEAEGIGLKSMSFMPDHVHLAFRGNPLRSPAEIAEGCWRALNGAAGLRLFSDRVYVGSFSSYSRQSIRV